MYANFCIECTPVVMLALHVCKILYRMCPAGHVSNARQSCMLTALNAACPFCITHAVTDMATCD